MQEAKLLSGQELINVIMCSPPLDQPMARIITLYGALFLLGLAAADAWPQTTQLGPREDTQLWSEVKASHTLRQDTDLLLGGALRWGRDVRHLVYERLGAGLSFKLGESSRWRKYVTISPLYAYFATQPFAGQDKRENRITLDTRLRVPFGRWTVSDRSAIERRFLDPKDTTRYRNRIRFEREMKLAHTRVFASDEVSYEWRYRAWTRNRFIVGAGKSLNERVGVDIYYVRQEDDHARPGNLNAVGVTLRTRF